MLLRFYFQIYAGSIKGPQVIEFLKQLQRHIPGKLLILWDGAPIHRSALVRDYLASTRGRVEVERLPAYAPELNPVEYMWGHCGLSHKMEGVFRRRHIDLGRIGEGFQHRLQ